MRAKTCSLDILCVRPKHYANHVVLNKGESLFFFTLLYYLHEVLNVNSQVGEVARNQPTLIQIPI